MFVGNVKSVLFLLAIMLGVISIVPSAFVHAEEIIIVDASCADVEHVTESEDPEVEDVYGDGICDDADTFKTLEEAVAAAQENDTIVLNNDVTLDAQVTLSTAGITLNGNEHTIKASFPKTGAPGVNNSAISIQRSGITITNVTIDGTGGRAWPDQLHGINTYKVDDVRLENVTIMNFGGSGVVVNGSSVIAEGLNTSGNAWNGVNIDPGSGVTEGSVFTLNSGNLEEDRQIWSDGKYVNESTGAIVTVNAEGYEEYTLVDTAGTYGAQSKIWLNKEAKEKGAIINAISTSIYTKIQNAINAAVAGDEVSVAAGTYAENLTISKGITLQGAGVDLTTLSPTSGRTIDIKADSNDVSNLIIDGFTIIADDISIALQSNSQANDGYDGHNYVYSNLVIDMNGKAGTAIGLFDVEDVTIDNVTVKNSTAAAAGAIEVVGARNLTIKNSTVTNNEIGFKIFTVAGYEANENVRIENTEFTGNKTNTINDDANLTLDLVDNSGDTTVEIVTETTYPATEEVPTAVEIPAGVVVTASSPDWDGTIAAPQVVQTTVAPVARARYEATPVLSIEVGADVALTFDKAVKLVFAGHAGKKVGWSRDGVFTPINDDCPSDPDDLNAGADCAEDDGADLVVWTKHFTTFTVYTESARSSSSSGSKSRSSRNTAVTTLQTPTAAPTVSAVVTTATFARDLGVGARGEDVTALQNRLIVEGVYEGPVTGYFGPLTEEAVKRYQTKVGVASTGFVGPITRAELQKGTSAAAVTTPAENAEIAALRTKLQALLQELVAELQKQVQVQ